MFELAFDHERHVVWASFSGIFKREHLVILDEIGRVTLGAEGLLDCVYDFSAVEGNEIETSDIVERGQRPRDTTGKRRVIVGTRPEMLRLARIFAAAQVMVGSTFPGVVQTRDEARRALGIDTLDLRPIDLGELARFLGVAPASDTDSSSGS